MTITIILPLCVSGGGGGGGRGVWFPAHSNVNCTGKAVKITIYDNSVG